MRCFQLVVVAAGAVLAAGCGGGYSTSPSQDTSNPAAAQSSAGNRVLATSDLEFSPAEIHVAVGDTVSFVFGATAHAIAFRELDDTAAYYGVLLGGHRKPGTPADIASTQNATVKRVFTTRGTFHYFCTIHPAAAGEIVVR